MCHQPGPEPLHPRLGSQSAGAALNFLGAAPSLLGRMGSPEFCICPRLGISVQIPRGDLVVAKDSMGETTGVRERLPIYRLPYPTACVVGMRSCLPRLRVYCLSLFQGMFKKVKGCEFTFSRECWPASPGT